jgi:hypothetical protein
MSRQKNERQNSPKLLGTVNSVDSVVSELLKQRAEVPDTYKVQDELLVPTLSVPQELKDKLLAKLIEKIMSVNTANSRTATALAVVYKVLTTGQYKFAFSRAELAHILKRKANTTFMYKIIRQIGGKVYYRSNFRTVVDLEPVARMILLELKSEEDKKEK